MISKSFIFVLLTSLFWGITPIFDKFAITRGGNPVAGVMVRTVGVGLFSVLCILFSNYAKEIIKMSPKTAILFVIGGILAGFIGQLTYFFALKGEQASIVIPLCSSFPIFTLIFSYLILGEPINLRKVLGTVLIIFGVVIIKV